MRIKTPGEWTRRAACHDAPPEIFITKSDGDEDDEPYYPTLEARRYCERCPVRVECFAWGIAYDEFGVWGGTTRYQRSLLRRVMTRQRCPACARPNVVSVRQHQLCLTCGMSWLKGRDAQ